MITPGQNDDTTASQETLRDAINDVHWQFKCSLDPDDYGAYRLPPAKLAPDMRYGALFLKNTMLAPG